jgi:hypothetical protein
MFSTKTISLPKISKNRYEILFFNKESMCNILSKIEKSGIKNSNSENNNSKNENENSSSEKLSISNQDAEAIAKKIETTTTNTKNTKKCEINFSNSNQINYLEKYHILKNFCYLRAYFRYTDKNTLNKRFKNTNEKKFNYIKKYNNSSFIKMVSFFKPIIIGLRKRNILFTKYTEEQINDGIDILKNKYKKIDSNSNKEISKLLNQRVSDRESHYTNIKDALKILKKNTGGYINYCIILDIKKSNLLSINKITKEKNINNNNNNNKYYNNNNNKYNNNNNNKYNNNNNNNNNQSGGQMIFVGNTKDKKYVDKSTFLIILGGIMMILQITIEIAKAMKK